MRKSRTETMLISARIPVEFVELIDSAAVANRSTRGAIIRKMLMNRMLSTGLATPRVEMTV